MLLNILGPKQISEMFHEYQPARSLILPGDVQVVVPRAVTKQAEIAFCHYAAYC